MEHSCIVRHFQHFRPLSESDADLLKTLEQDPVKYRKNATVWSEHEEETHFFTLKSGWACAFHNLEDGSRQILDIFVPGDIIGIRECAFRRRLVSVVTLTEAELCPFPQDRLARVFAQSSTLAGLFFMISSADQAILLQRLINLGRRNALVKLSHFLVEICERLKRACVELDQDFHLPLSQALLGDALGLSAVHVNRTVKILKEKQLIARGHGSVDVLDLNGLKKIANFDESYLERDSLTALVDGVTE